MKRAEAGRLDGVNVLLRPVSAESLDNGGDLYRAVCDA